jgi:hypothetical protein
MYYNSNKVSVLQTKHILRLHYVEVPPEFITLHNTNKIAITYSKMKTKFLLIFCNMSATFLCVVSELWCLILMFANAMLYAICHYSYVVRPHVELQMRFAIFYFLFQFHLSGNKLNPEIH